MAHVNASEKIEDNKFTITNGPSPRYGHASCFYKSSFVMYGGTLANGSLSNEFWLFNISTKSWSRLALKSSVQPPKLTRHTITFVSSNNFIYLFGGSLENNEFSSQMYRINASLFDQWEFVFPRGGKSYDHRVTAHSTVFHKDSNSLLIYGGIIAGIARFSKLSDRIYSFNLNENYWTEIHYPKQAQRESYIPRERAFHTAILAGEFMIVFGGYSHRHNKEEICYDNQMYLYHLRCHSWINQEIFGSNRQQYPKKQGAFAHTTVLRGDNTLLIAGGYHGIVNNDFLAFTLPNSMIPSK